MTGEAVFDFISLPAFAVAFILHMFMGMVRSLKLWKQEQNFCIRDVGVLIVWRLTKRYECTHAQIWYHPKIFGNAFMRLAHGGHKAEPDAVAMKAAVLGSLIAMPFFAFMLSVVRCRTPGEGSLWGFAFGLFFDGGLNASHSFFEDRPFALFVLHRGYHIVSLSLIGTVLGALCGPSVSVWPVSLRREMEVLKLLLRSSYVCAVLLNELFMQVLLPERLILLQCCYQLEGIHSETTSAYPLHATVCTSSNKISLYCGIVAWK